MAQLEGEKLLERARDVDILVGTHNLHRVPDLLDEAAATGRVAVDLDRRADAFAIPEEMTAHGNPVRAFVTAMEGCNHVCSFCVVPRTRGPEVNRSPDDIVREVEGLVARGFAEVMLLGQTVNAYRQGDTDFAGLLARVDGVAGLRRLRFTTSHPEHVDAGMADALRDLPRVCPYLHLPFQSGSDRVLGSMRRGYTRQQYLDTVALLRDRVPHLALSSDVIVGYPGETRGRVRGDAAGAGDRGLRRPLHLRLLPAPGDDGSSVCPTTCRRPRRSGASTSSTRTSSSGSGAATRAGWGTVDEVLVETADGEGRVSGRTPHFRIVHLEGAEDLVGQFVSVEITGAGSNSLQGRLSQAVH